MILAATMLWAVEVILVKRLLDSIAVRTLAVARMGIGTVILVGWVAVSGRPATCSASRPSNGAGPSPPACS